ncbi:MAG: hypothetical protein ABSF92_02645 [Candidatus Acidiferrales bacterium]
MFIPLFDGVFYKQTQEPVNMEEKAKVSEWDEAVVDYERKLKRAKTRVLRIEEAIETFKRSKEQGREWPSAATQ